MAERVSSPGISRPLRDLEIRDVVLVRLPRHSPRGYEQEGLRPGVIVGVPRIAGEPRFPVLLLAPFTTDRGYQWSYQSPELYPRLESGAGHLSTKSICLLDQTRAIDLSRVVRRWGRSSADEFAPIQNGIQMILGFMPAD
jgi:mRNA interferase MazF